MRLPRLILIIIFFSRACGSFFAQDSLRIISYNVENLFDCEHDTLKNDSLFLPEGMNHWTYDRYATKLDRIAQVIVNISGWESVDLIGLCEVENVHCLRDLCYRLRRFHYKYVHYESMDERGVDVALLYDSTKVKVLDSRPLYVDLGEDKTRDILYVSALINSQDTFHVLVCHFPSRLGGSAETEWKRIAVKRVIEKEIYNILSISTEAKIVVMGDMNDIAKNDLHGLQNKMIELESAGKGTHKFQGVWSCLDQIYVSDILKDKSMVRIFSPKWILEEDKKHLGYQPKRTFVGYRYQGGYSDHLPVVMTVQL